jgi:geranylgeranyl transferase type-2 subunit beta
MKSYFFLLWLAAGVSAALPGSRVIGQTQKFPTIGPDEVQAGVRQFFAKNANADGSFHPGIDPDYEGISDSAFSDLAPVTYAVTLHKTFGWRLPHEEKTREFLLARQKEDGAFLNVKGTADPNSPLARLYNTTQGLVALHALGSKPRYDPIPVFARVLKKDYRSLPPYSTSFFPLAYLVCGRPFPAEEDRKIRALMLQAEDGYLNNHIAATFHMVHYYRLISQRIPKADAILKRVLDEQKPDGSWLLNPPARDRHATYDAVFVIRQLGKESARSRKAMEQAARWALSCRNPDGGFGHFPGCASDVDAVYFQVGTLVMAGFLKPVDPLPQDPHLLSWGHLMPPP